MSSCRQRSRSAEQRWPAERNADVDHVVDHLLRQRGGVNNHGVDAASLGDQRHDGSVFPGEGPVDGAADFSRAGKHDPGDTRIGDELRANIAVAGNQVQRGDRHAGFMQQRDRAGGDQRRLLGRLGDNGVPGHERSAHLTEKNRERKIPWTDADKNAAAAVTQQIAFAGRPRHQRGRQRMSRLRGVVAAIVDRLAHFRKRIVKRLAAFGLQEREQGTAILLQQIGGTFEPYGARRARRRFPRGTAGRRRRHR